MSFFIDKGNVDSNQESQVKNVASNSIVKELLTEYKATLQNSSKISVAKPKEDIFKTFSDEMGWTKKKTSKISNHFTNNSEAHIIKDDIDKILKKSVITPEFEDLHQVPPYEVSEKKLREQRRKERAKSKGKKWYGLPATEMTNEVKRDLEVLQMRSVLDPKHFYKKNDLKVLPKYFQVGKVLDSPLEFYNNRLSRRARKKTLVAELLADAEFSKYNKRKYKEIIEEKQKTHYKAWREAKKLKRKNK